MDVTVRPINRPAAAFGGKAMLAPPQRRPAAPRGTAEQRAEHRDFMAAGIAIAAIVLMVGSASSWLLIQFGYTAPIEHSAQIAGVTVLLNGALILLATQRFHALRAEIARRSAAEADALTLAMHDPLTQFLNRRALSDLADDQMLHWRARGLQTGLLLIDFDAFKSINDLFGHAGGDIMIQTQALRIAMQLPDDALMARMGGDEFVALVPIAGDATAALAQIAAALIALLRQPVQIDMVATASSASIGGAIAAPNGAAPDGAAPDGAAPDGAPTPLETLLRQADTALYRAKAAGRSCYQLFDASMDAASARRTEIERALRLAIPNGELFPVYEPLIDLSTHRPTGYEMLARWVSPVFGTVDPLEFIPVAEEAGLIGALFDRLVRRALADVQDWPPTLDLSINIAAMQLRDPRFASQLVALADQLNFPPNRLIIDVTEKAVADNLPLARSAFATLKAAGIRIALDDFGAGHSALPVLKSLPFDMVKIDRSFVAQMADDAAASTIGTAVIELGQSLGLPVVAEGIESRAIADRLASLGCTAGQGHYLGPAMPSAALLAHHHGDAAASHIGHQQRKHA